MTLFSIRAAQVVLVGLLLTICACGDGFDITGNFPPPITPPGNTPPSMPPVGMPGDAGDGAVADAGATLDALDVPDAADALYTVDASDAGDAGVAKTVFIFAGQSNMAGADAVIDPATFVRMDADRQALYSFTELPPAYDASSDYLPFGEIQGHHCCVRYNNPEPVVIGPEVGFTRRLAEDGTTDIVIVAAWGRFTAVAPTWPWGVGGSLDVAWMAYVDHQLAELRSRGIDPQIRGFGWFQGIDDALLPAPWANDYGARLTALIAFLRARFALPNAPFVLARSVNSSLVRGTTGSGPNDPMAVVRAAQVQVGTTVPRATWVDVDDLPNVDIHHFSSTSQLEIGRRFGEAYLRIRASDPLGQ
jgi:hypothetical protein